MEAGLDVRLFEGRAFPYRQLAGQDICLREGCSGKFQCSCVLRQGLLGGYDSGIQTAALVQGLSQGICPAVSVGVSYGFGKAAEK